MPLLRDGAYKCWAIMGDLVEVVIAIIVILGGAIGSAINAKKQKQQSSPLDEELNRPALDDEESTESASPRQRRPQYPTAQPLPQPGQRADSPQVRPTVRPVSQPTFPPVVAPGPVLRPRPVRSTPRPVRSGTRKPAAPSREERRASIDDRKPERLPIERVPAPSASRPTVPHEVQPVAQQVEPTAVASEKPMGAKPKRASVLPGELRGSLAAGARQAVSDTPRRRDVRSMLRSSSVSGLRDAIVLAELLGPPLALRENDPLSPRG